MFEADEIKVGLTAALTEFCATPSVGTKQELILTLNKTLTNYMDGIISRYNREVVLREWEVKVREEACTRLVVEYQKRVAELELQISNKEKK